MKLNHIYKSIACGVLLAMTATSCDLDYNPVDTYSDVTEGVNKTESCSRYRRLAESLYEKYTNLVQRDNQ